MRITNFQFGPGMENAAGGNVGVSWTLRLKPTRPGNFEPSPALQADPGNVGGVVSRPKSFPERPHDQAGGCSSELAGSRRPPFNLRTWGATGAEGFFRSDK